VSITLPVLADGGVGRGRPIRMLDNGGEDRISEPLYKGEGEALPDDLLRGASVRIEVTILERVNCLACDHCRF
jgi:hypothetical protein